MLRKKSPIKQGETIATILSEDVQTITLVMSVFKGQKRLIIVQEALALLQKGVNSGYTDPEYEEKLLLFKGLLNNQ